MVYFWYPFRLYTRITILIWCICLTLSIVCCCPCFPISCIIFCTRNYTRNKSTLMVFVFFPEENDSTYQTLSRYGYCCIILYFILPIEKWCSVWYPFRLYTRFHILIRCMCLALWIVCCYPCFPIACIILCIGDIGEI